MFKQFLLALVALLFMSVKHIRHVPSPYGEDVCEAPTILSTFRNRMVSFLEGSYANLMKSYELIEGVVMIKPRDKRGQSYENFALKSSGARVVKTAGGVLKPSAFLSPDETSYVSFPCKTGGKSKVFIDVYLQEDALVEKVGLTFTESYMAFPRVFEILLSSKAGDDNWRSVGIFSVVRDENKQWFTLEKPGLARWVKIKIIDSYDSPHYYCTITQFIVTGKTYLSFTTDKAASRISEELKHSTHKPDEKKVIQLPEKHKHFKARKEKEALESTSVNPFFCINSVFEGLERPMCSAESGLIEKVAEEGPLESYFDVLSLKIQKLEKETISLQTKLQESQAQQNSPMKRKKRQAFKDDLALRIKETRIQKKFSNPQRYEYYKKLELLKAILEETDTTKGPRESLFSLVTFGDVLIIAVVAMFASLVTESIRNFGRNTFSKRINFKFEEPLSKKVYLPEGVDMFPKTELTHSKRKKLVKHKSVYIENNLSNSTHNTVNET